MEFLKNFFKHDKNIIGLSGLKKTPDYVKLTIPETYKKAYVSNVKPNYLLM